MATQVATIAYILDQMNTGAAAGGGPTVSARKMFGEYAVYADGRVIALVCDDTLYMKITEPGREFLGGEYREGPPYPGAKPYMKIDVDQLENREWLAELVAITTAHTPLPKPKKPKK